MMLEGFEQKQIETDGATINLVVGGSGPPLLLLHGYPETHVMWHHVAPRLAQDFTVVAADLRGYGDSSKPEGGDDHSGYSKRAMAQDQVEVMAALHPLPAPAAVWCETTLLCSMGVSQNLISDDLNINIF